MEFELSSGLHRDAVERVDATFPFAVLLISIGSKSGTPFLPESAIACQHYFSDFFIADLAARLRRNRKVKRRWHR